ncbi:ribosomal protein S18 acetylase RimI-like enzyme [Actinoplanes lutulentus]|uniref:Acetyltransferase (GNAT) family protein n=1 Tax=Actinoplanes lutulentus TaxID=1287878 RepID=A0A327Z322_9ACTN|nr:GNAT family N-acetyltransferase [Actinoplanes lutulentus]MBB2943539.1 ribosomal protein S18 acetylase RimI-like enzyme [Actinoplanes lutulentus]RAK27405.1 acetyltransferase (GNAT) family protein [Actinoplanes lutulentus]
MSDPVIRPIREDEVETVGAFISNAFDDLAANHYLVPVPAERETVMAGFFSLESETAFKQGRIEVIDHPDGGYAAAAVWFDRVTDLPEAEAYMERLETITGDHFERFGALGELFDKNHPHEPHWHLAFLGVRPSEQGKSLGSLMMKHVHDELDANGTAAYLEATNQNNVRLYRRHGYQPMDPCEIYLPDGTAFYRMWRAAS